LDLASGRIQRLSDEDIPSRRIPVSPDGRWIAAADGEGGIRLHPLQGGGPRSLPGVVPGEQPMGWAGPTSVLVGRPQPESTEVDRIDIATGVRSPGPRLAPPDPAGIVHVGSQVFSPDGGSYVYSYIRVRSDLFLVETAR
jgi:hypothetical protein